MSMSNYTSGFSAGALIKGAPLFDMIAGKVFWVDSNAGGGNFGTFDQPVTTIDTAVGLCRANKGDMIFCKPGHTENLATATSLALDVAGITVTGIGRGAATPTLTLTTAATATIAISAASVAFVNIRVVANFADIVAMFTVTATEALIDGVQFTAAATDMNWIDVIDVPGADNLADGLTVVNCQAFGLDASNDSFIEIANDINRLVVINNFVVHDVVGATPFVEFASGAIALNVMIKGNSYHTLTTTADMLVTNSVTTNTGEVSYNLASHAMTTSDISVDLTGAGMFENFSTGVITVQGYQNPGRDS